MNAGSGNRPRCAGRNTAISAATWGHERHVDLRGDARSRREAAVGYGLVPSQALGPLTLDPMCARLARGLLGVLRRPLAPNRTAVVGIFYAP